MKAQNGSVLVVALVLLTILTILATSTMSLASLEEKMAKNHNDGVVAFNEAENGLSTAYAEALTNFTAMVDGYTAAGNSSNWTNFEYEVVATMDEAGMGNGLRGMVVRSTGTTTTGARRIVNAIYARGNIPVNIDSALSLHPAGSVTLKGNSTISGLNHDVPTDFDCNGSGCNGSLNGADDGIGIYSDTDVGDLTEIGSTTLEGSPPTQNGGGLYDQDYWIEWATNMIPFASVHNGADADGNPSWGTRDNPVVHVIDQNMLINSNLDGAGILIITGDNTGVTINGNFHFEGLIVATSPTAVDLSVGGTARIFGSVVAASPSVEIDVGASGTPGILFSLEALGSLDNISTVRRLAWFEEVQ
jgi:hypothetical protein